MAVSFGDVVATTPKANNSPETTSQCGRERGKNSDRFFVVKKK